MTKTQEISPQALSQATPMMQQWYRCKQMAKDALLLFRMGDFYEAFYEDAQIISKAADLTLTKRQGIPMSGIPHQTLDSYLDRLIAKGYRIAIAEQTEDPKKTKGLVKREIVRMVTPATIVNSQLIEEKSNNFFASIEQVGSIFGLSFIDLTTAEFRVIEFENLRDLLSEVFRLHPSEFLCSEKFKKKHEAFFSEIKLSYDYLLNTQETWKFDHQSTYQTLSEHFKTHSLDGFGLKGMVAGINAAGALLNYLKEDLSLNLKHILNLKTYYLKDYMSLDKTTQINLELSETLKKRPSQNTLQHTLDKTQTPMGGRLLHNWIKQPLLSLGTITKRQDAVEALLKSPSTLSSLREKLTSIRDLERLMMKVSSSYAGPRDLAFLRLSLENIPWVKKHLSHVSSELLHALSKQIHCHEDLQKVIKDTLVDDPPQKITDGHCICSGFHEELDTLKTIRSSSKQYLADYQNKLREETGIRTLKIGYTKVFGYYIDVSKGQASKMPEHFTRRQTLVNNERFISPELKEYENKVLGAEEKILQIEVEIFNQLRQNVSQHLELVLKTAQGLAYIDCLQSLAQVAKKNNYKRPLLVEDKLLEIQEGRHPVLENIAPSVQFIPNDTYMDPEKERLFIITGPNMAGKSTYIRQVALLIIMAQIGSFIPVKKAKIGLVDKVFTRIGASDDLARGQSTFMVEMTETANILNNVTEKSLVILDEIGRGTSTYDGISIAWAVAEYLLNQKNKNARTLFATHYWELTRLENLMQGAVNYNVAVREWNDEIIFLHKIIKGGADKSYGIQVARLAGIPQEAICRAKHILSLLEESRNHKKPTSFSQKKVSGAPKPNQETQLMLFEDRSQPKKSSKKEKALEKIKRIDLNHTTPIEAHQQLQQLQKILSSC